MSKDHKDTLTRELVYQRRCGSADIKVARHRTSNGNAGIEIRLYLKEAPSCYQMQTITINNAQFGDDYEQVATAIIETVEKAVGNYCALPQVNR